MVTICENIKNITNSEEVIVYLGINKYLGLIKKAEENYSKSEIDINKLNSYQETLNVYIEQLSRFDIEYKSEKIYEWIINWEKYIDNLATHEYRILIDSIISNKNLMHFKVSKPNNIIRIYNFQEKKLINERHNWIKEYLNKNIINENIEQPIRKIK